jgi:hypothetical protein
VKLDMRRSLEKKLDMLEARGIRIVDRRQTYLDEQLDVRRVSSGAVLYPGTRLLGARTFVGPGAKIGIEGPAVLEDTIIGENAEVASGYLKGAVMLRGSRVGANAHVRGGTLLEEEASTAHAVGLKHTVLMSFVTLGSLINFCDALISGGRSRREYTEVGSGFIHFNHTPRGRSGDKATPSLIGDVVQGVFLREQRIFLGGLSGIVGPQKVGFGSLTVAGQVVRRQVPPHRIVGDVGRRVDKRVDELAESTERIVSFNLEYIGQLLALQAWYQGVRFERIPYREEYDHLRIVTKAASDLIALSITERLARLFHFLEERNIPAPVVSLSCPLCPLYLEPSEPYLDHVPWVQSLSDSDRQCFSAWLLSIVKGVCSGLNLVDL